MRSGVTPGYFSTSAEVDGGETMAQEFEGGVGGVGGVGGDPVLSSHGGGSPGEAVPEPAGPGSSP